MESGLARVPEGNISTLSSPPDSSSRVAAHSSKISWFTPDAPGQKCAMRRVVEAWAAEAAVRPAMDAVSRQRVRTRFMGVLRGIVVMGLAVWTYRKFASRIHVRDISKLPDSCASGKWTLV